MTDATFRHNVDRERFEVLVDGHVIGKAAYKAYDDTGSPQRIFYHTVINDEFGGQGLAGRLADVALKETVGEGVGIVPVCPFIKKFLTKHPEYAANTTAPTLAHLEYLNAALAPAARS
ncbi:GNAT family N-acetyltransferase [Arthrobacter sp. SRS-W-1-2016]|uniref:GNAT family N-acetyltransferase n=1 Tax=Arthrobacter sp. SRS-W-1-2016 TaxID=1930254 RepID=UPI00099124E8|nr:GNAT family N-acetyltransferase [Arthrobacter sp. SRS-W-1-2016]OOP63662.1 GNAT family N-acetyltransferase [Arthrobacter sp. SRS-W-1-2016]